MGGIWEYGTGQISVSLRKLIAFLLREAWKPGSWKSYRVSSYGSNNFFAASVWNKNALFFIQK